MRVGYSGTSLLVSLVTWGLASILICGFQLLGQKHWKLGCCLIQVLTLLLLETLPKRL